MQLMEHNSIDRVDVLIASVAMTLEREVLPLVGVLDVIDLHATFDGPDGVPAVVAEERDGADLMPQRREVSLHGLLRVSADVKDVNVLVCCSHHCDVVPHVHGVDPFWQGHGRCWSSAAKRVGGPVFDSSVPARSDHHAVRIDPMDTLDGLFVLCELNDLLRAEIPNLPLLVCRCGENFGAHVVPTGAKNWSRVRVLRHLHLSSRLDRKPVLLKGIQGYRIIPRSADKIILVRRKLYARNGVLRSRVDLVIVLPACICCDDA
mmetsp:Transcript_38222/g.120353  ORF Transcript_38222/g.120353 Transcript_38222/m.120353 type:complete len:262 (+) Transcript_38222:319-1104(+)